MHIKRKAERRLPSPEPWRRVICNDASKQSTAYTIWSFIYTDDDRRFPRNVGTRLATCTSHTRKLIFIRHHSDNMPNPTLAAILHRIITSNANPATLSGLRDMLPLVSRFPCTSEDTHTHTHTGQTLRLSIKSSKVQNQKFTETKPPSDVLWLIKM